MPESWDRIVPQYGKGYRGWRGPMEGGSGIQALRTQCDGDPSGTQFAATIR